MASAIETIEPAIAQLIWDAPHRDPNTIATLHAALRSVGTPLAVSIARVLEHVAGDVLDPAVALPALAEAAATLAARHCGALDDTAVEAARYQLEMLQPMQPKPATVVPLRRR